LFSAFFLFQKLVVKPDQLIKRRGKLGLIKVGTDAAGAKAWIDERMGKQQLVS
jgi:ATP citrate (pro-S)-lyase